MSTTTTNYDLIIAEGTDKYNHLVIDNPNYRKIDEQMKTNEIYGIPTATELKSGTVHALTRSKPDASMFRFTATSNFTAGETFTVDNTQVTALLTTGETLPSNCYVIGSEVVCVLVGTRLTVFVSFNEVPLAEDSEKLGGQLPAYYATAVQNELAMSTATAAGTLAEKNERDITELKSDFAELITETSLENTKIGTIDDKNLYRIRGIAQLDSGGFISAQLNLKTVYAIYELNAAAISNNVIYNIGTNQSMAYISASQKLNINAGSGFANQNVMFTIVYSSNE